jgi:hypothetical protein
MEKYVIDSATITAIADSIRQKKDTTAKIKPENMPEEIRGITAGENLDPVLTEQDVMIARIKAALQGKVIGGNEPTTIIGSNLHDTATDIPNTYISGASVLAYNGWTSTDYIRVEEGKYYLAYSTSAINSNYCSRFDSSKGNAKAVGGVINCTNKNRPAFMLGHDGYFRFSGTNAQIAALEFYEVANFNWEV